MRFVVVPAAYVFCVREGEAGPEVLLQLRQNTGYMDDHWAAGAAGHVERGETAYDAARREACEELGLEDIALDFQFTMQRTQHAEPIDERVDFFFTSRSWAGELLRLHFNRHGVLPLYNRPASALQRLQSEATGPSLP